MEIWRTIGRVASAVGPMNAAGTSRLASSSTASVVQLGRLFFDLARSDPRIEEGFQDTLHFRSILRVAAKPPKSYFEK